MSAIQERARKSEAIARESLSRLSNERLAETWMLTNKQSMTGELAVVRGWLLDELETRMGRMDVWADTFVELNDFGGDRFGAWLEAECTAKDAPVSPLPYLI